MVTTVVILAFLALVVVAGWYFLAQRFAWSVKVKRHLIHDVAGNANLVELALHNDSPELADVGLETIRAILGETKPRKLKLARVVMPLCRFVENATGVPVNTELNYDVYKVVGPEPLRRCLTNLILNAVEAAKRVGRDIPVLVRLTARGIMIHNPATVRDMNALLREQGLTTKSDEGHGIGRGSAALAKDKLGWDLAYEFDPEGVVTILRWPEEEEERPRRYI